MDPSAPLWRPVSRTALVLRCGAGWPERVAGAAGPLADLAALVSLGLPGIPGPLQLRSRGSRQPPPGAEGPELQVRLDRIPADGRHGR